MTAAKNVRIGIAVTLVLTLIAAIALLTRPMWDVVGKTDVVAYFDNSNGLFSGDEVRVLGVPVGEIDAIEPQPHRVKITFWIDDKYKVPAEARAVIIAPQLVTARAIQLTPAYDGGPALTNGAVIPQERTAVPVEWDDLRQQLQKLSDALQPTQPGGVSTLGALVNTTADNLRGQGVSIRDAVIKLSQAFSALGDHSTDIFSTVKNLATLVTALQSSTDLMGQLNGNLAAVTALLANDPNEVGKAVSDIDTVAAQVQGFVADNREAVGTTSDKLASISTALVGNLDDIKQLLHVAPNTFQNFVNIYQPAQAGLTAALALNNFADPISFICGAIQAASRLGAAQSAKLCVQYLAPIVKNRQYNFLPIGLNPFVGAQARPNEVTYSEDWMRPDFVPPQVATPGPPLAAESAPEPGPPAPAAEVPAQPATATDPTAGLPGMMLPGGSR